MEEVSDKNAKEKMMKTLQMLLKYKNLKPIYLFKIEQSISDYENSRAK
jgi:hypothetical protein